MIKSMRLIIYYQSHTYNYFILFSILSRVFLAKFNDASIFARCEFSTLPNPFASLLYLTMLTMLRTLLINLVNANISLPMFSSAVTNAVITPLNIPNQKSFQLPAANCDNQAMKLSSEDLIIFSQSSMSFLAFFIHCLASLFFFSL